ncbi:MAG TPA: tetratricopeptide repeat protein [Chitinophagaceae bacterium]|nr:tetratricopeptide repeat protein [Chitinophagaceae bacterium]
MRKYLILIGTCFLSLLAMAQTLEDGKKFMYYDRWQSAARTFEELIRREPIDMEPRYWMVQLLLKQDKTAEARQALQAAQQQVVTKEHPLLKVANGAVLLHENQATEAAQQFEDALKDTRERDPEVLLAIVRAHLDAKQTNYPYLLELLEKAQKRDKNNPEVYDLEGDVHRRMGDGGKAVQAYSAALQKNSGYAKSLYNIGKIYLTQQNAEMFLKYFTEAVQKDPAYTPALYELYYYYYFRDVNLAKDYLDRYIANRDASVENEYMLTDLLYVSSKHQEALNKAKQLLQQEGAAAPARLYKLVAYSYEALGDSTNALAYIDQYFQRAHDTSLVAKDFELRAALLQKFAGREAEAITVLQKAIDMDTVAANKVEYMGDLATLYKKQGDRSKEAFWLGKLYETKADPSNLDLYYWGLAHYSAQEYKQADSVFGLYTEKYPDHIHGFYWRAKSNALIDTSMEQGLAVPYYQKVIEIAAAEPDKNKSLLIQAYGYAGAYEANVRKDFEAALVHFNKILELDPQNADAIRYSDILKKWVKAETEKGQTEKHSGN